MQSGGKKAKWTLCMFWSVPQRMKTNEDQSDNKTPEDEVLVRKEKDYITGFVIRIHTAQQNAQSTPHQ